MKINLGIENVGGFGVKTTKKKGKVGQNLHENLYPEFNQIKGKVQGDERDFEK